MILVFSSCSLLTQDEVLTSVSDMYVAHSWIMFEENTILCGDTHTYLPDSPEYVVQNSLEFTTFLL